jgi:hypothetical protein
MAWEEEDDPLAPMADEGMRIEDDDPLAPESKERPMPGKPEEKPKEDPALKTVLEELEQLKQRNRELAESERYWAARAKQGGKPEAPADEPDEDDLPAVEDIDISPDAFLDELEKKGPKAILEVVKKAGFVPASEAKAMAERIADKRLQAERDRMQAEAKIFREFPDLADEQSDLYKETAKVFREMVEEDPALANSTAAFKSAARLAQRSLSGGAASKKEPASLQERMLAESRRERVAQQGFSRGVQSPGEDDDELTPTQKMIARNLGVSEAEYRKYAKAGVTMAGIPRGRR